MDAAVTYYTGMYGRFAVIARVFSDQRQRGPSMSRRNYFIGALVFGLLTMFSSSVIPVGAADAEVRVIHASPDTPPVDVFVDDRKAISSLAFGLASDYVSLPAGKHTFRVFASGTSPADSRAVITVGGIDVPANAKLSIVAIGLFASMQAITVDDRTPAPRADKVKLRLIHVGPEIPAVDVTIGGGPVLFTRATFGNQYPYQQIDPGQYMLGLRTTGKGDVAGTANFTLVAGRAYSVYLMSLGVVRVFQDFAETQLAANVDSPQPALVAVGPLSATPMAVIGGNEAAITALPMTSALIEKAQPMGVGDSLSPTPVAVSSLSATPVATGGGGGTMITALPMTGLPSLRAAYVPGQIFAGITALCLLSTGFVLRRRSLRPKYSRSE